MAKNQENEGGKLTQDQLLTLYRNLVRTQKFDQWCLKSIMAGEFVGFYHAGDGAYAPGVAIGTFLNKEDVLQPHLRAHGLGHMLSKGVDVKRYLAEHTAKATGCCKGRSSYHFCFPEDNLFGTSGCIGSNFPPSVGYGLAAKKNGRGQVVVNCFGDGGSNRGTFHEAVLMANNWKLPIIFQCENNGLAIFAKAEDMHPTQNISDLAAGYGMPSVVVDGQDVIACAEAALVAIAHARAGKGPYMIEAKTARFMSHAVGVPDLADFTPRSEGDLAMMRERDPIVICRQRLLAEGVLNEDLVEQIENEAQSELAAAENFIKESPVADQLDLSDISKLVYAD